MYNLRLISVHDPEIRRCEPRVMFELFDQVGRGVSVTSHLHSPTSQEPHKRSPLPGYRRKGSSRIFSSSSSEHLARASAMEWLRLRNRQSILTSSCWGVDDHHGLQKSSRRVPDLCQA